MPSLIAYSGITLALVLAAGSASAAELVTTSDTEGPTYFVTIIEPLDGAVLAGKPDAVVSVVMEFEAFDGGFDVNLHVDDQWVDRCDGQTSPCTLEITLTPGPHTLEARIGGDEHAIAVTVEDTSEAGTDTSGSPTTGDADTTDTDATDTDAATTGDGAATSGDGGGDKGCVCSTGSSGPDLLGLALAVLLAPRRRRRR